VIDTLAVTDAQPPEGQPAGRNGDGKSQDQESEGIAVKKDAELTTDRRLPWYRLAAAAVLLLVAIGLVLWLFARPPHSFAVMATLVVAAAVAFGGSAVCLPLGLRRRLGTFTLVAGTTAAILAAVLAIPDRSPASSGSDQSNGPARPTSTPSAAPV
jgi:hypothetical protein